MASVVFDYRRFGDSDGEPRQVLDLRRQCEDWDAAIAFALGLDGVDPSRVVLWGTSFSGGHVVDAAVRNPEVAAVITQAPFMDGLAKVLIMPPQIGARLVFDGVSGELRRLRGRPPLTVPATRPPRRAAHEAPKGELRTYKNMDHFDVYAGEGFELLSRDQIAFLNRVLA